MGFAVWWSRVLRRRHEVSTLSTFTLAERAQDFQYGNSLKKRTRMRVPGDQLLTSKVLTCAASRLPDFELDELIRDLIGIREGRTAGGFDLRFIPRSTKLAARRRMVTLARLREILTLKPGQALRPRIEKMVDDLIELLNEEDSDLIEREPETDCGED